MRATLAAHDDPIDAGEIQPADGADEGLDREKADRGIGLLQVSDARGRLVVLDGYAKPDMRRRRSVFVPIIDEFLQ